MNDQDDEFSDEEDGQEAEENLQNRKGRRKNMLKITGSEGMKTLEPKEKIDLRCYDQDYDVDPLFKQVSK